MNLKFNDSESGYTMVELLLVLAIMAILYSIISPKMGTLIQAAYQSKAQNNLGVIRSAIALYYTNNEGVYPLGSYPQGNSHYVVAGQSLARILAPKYLVSFPTPYLMDKASGFNGLPGLFYDTEAAVKMAKNPPEDVFIIVGAADYTPLLNAVFVYDNRTGLLYYANGNYSTRGDYFYLW
jgi:prepilin-type N-terminal cleavage/methylation domain-containing protein